MNTEKTPYFSKKISKKQATDSGMAFVLILLIIGYFTKNIVFYNLAIPALILNMIIPKMYYLFAILWFGLSNALGSVMSKLILTILYSIIVLPIGLLRRLLGKDSLQLKDYMKNDHSVFKTRNKTFSSNDIINPY